MRWLAAAGLAAMTLTFAQAAEPEKEKQREALKPFNDLVGSWKGTGVPEGSREEKQRGFWSETIAWEFQFKGDEVWMKATFHQGKHFSKAELRPLAEANHYRLTIETPDKQSLTFEGQLQDRKLMLERVDEKAK